MDENVDQEPVPGQQEYVERKLLPAERDAQMQLVGRYQAIGAILSGCMIRLGDRRTGDLQDQLVMLVKKAVLSAWEYADE